MKTFDVSGNLCGSGEYILGSAATGSHACYLVYGVLQPGEQGRELSPGAGHEELVLAVQGDIDLQGAFTGTLRQGKAIHLAGEERVTAGNSSAEPSVYVIAGGHSGTGHH